MQNDGLRLYIKQLFCLITIYNIFIEKTVICSLDLHYLKNAEGWTESNLLNVITESCKKLFF